jgi:hypothetical protein
MFGSLRPAAGAPRVIPVVIPIAGVGVATPGVSVLTPGSFGGDLICTYDILVGASPIAVHFIGSAGDEQAGVPLAAGATYSLPLCGLGGIRFRSSVPGATVTLVITPMMSDRPTQDPATFSDDELLNLPPSPDISDSRVLVSGYPG